MGSSITFPPNAREFQSTFFGTLSGWSASCLWDMTRASRETNRQDCEAFLLSCDTNTEQGHATCFRQAGFTARWLAPSVLADTPGLIESFMSDLITIDRCHARTGLLTAAPRCSLDIPAFSSPFCFAPRSPRRVRRGGGDRSIVLFGQGVWPLFILGYRPALSQIDANFHRRAWTFVVSGAEGKKAIRLVVVGG